MKKKYSLLALSLGIFMVLVLAGCGTPENSPKTSKTSVQFISETDTSGLGLPLIAQTSREEKSNAIYARSIIGILLPATYLFNYDNREDYLNNSFDIQAIDLIKGASKFSIPQGLRLKFVILLYSDVRTPQDFYLGTPLQIGETSPFSTKRGAPSSPDLSITYSTPGAFAGAELKTENHQLIAGSSLNGRIRVKLTSPLEEDAIIRATGNNPSGLIFDEEVDTTQISSNANSVDLLFTPYNWNEYQYFYIYGAEKGFSTADAEDFKVHLSLHSQDSIYSQIKNLGDVSFEILSPYDPGFILIPDDLLSSENGGTASFKIQLTSKPISDVVFNISGNPQEGILSQTTVTISPEAANTPFPITITGVDDSFADGDVSYPVMVSIDSNQTTDPNYRNLPEKSLLIKNEDDEEIGTTVNIVNKNGSLSQISSDSQSYQVWDNANSSENPRFQVSLNSKPISDVILDVKATRPERAGVGLTQFIRGSNNLQLTFTPGNWNVPQTFFHRIKQNSSADYDQSYQFIIRPRAEQNGIYAGLKPFFINFVSKDFETGRALKIEIPPKYCNGFSNLRASNDCTIGVNSVPFNFRISLASRISAYVHMEPTLTHISQDFSVQGNYDSFRPTSYNRNTVNQRTLRSFFLQGSSNAPGGQYGFLNLKIETPEVFAGRRGADFGEKSQRIRVLPNGSKSSELDYDQPEITLWENEGPVSLGIRRREDPSGDISYNLQRRGEFSFSLQDGSNQLNYTGGNSGNWNNFQYVRIDPSMDVNNQSDKQFTFYINSGIIEGGIISDTDFVDFRLKIKDIDAPERKRIVFQTKNTAFCSLNTNPETCEIAEDGEDETLLVSLGHRPIGNVTVDVVIPSDHTGDITTSKPSLTFTPNNWDFPQTLLFIPKRDFHPDGDAQFTVQFSPSDNEFSTTPLEMTVLDVDDPDSEINLSESSTLVLDEGDQQNINGGIRSIGVSLGRNSSGAPESLVSFDVTTDNPDAILVTPAVLTFSPSDFSIEKQIFVSAIDNDLSGDSYANVIINSRSTNPGFYGSSEIQKSLRVRVQDDDLIGVVIVNESSLPESISEKPLGNVSNSMVLSVIFGSKPRPGEKAKVDFSFLSEEIRVTPNTLYFDETNWDQTQDIQVIAVNDQVIDGDKQFDLEIETHLRGETTLRTKTLKVLDAQYPYSRNGNETLKVRFSDPTGTGKKLSAIRIFYFDRKGAFQGRLKQFFPANFSIDNLTEVYSLRCDANDPRFLVRILAYDTNGSLYALTSVASGRTSDKLAEGNFGCGSSNTNYDYEITN